MNIDNIEEAVFLQRQLKKIIQSLDEIEEILSCDKEEYSFYNQHDTFQYGLHICKHVDGSGPARIDLTGLGISRQVYLDIQAELTIQAKQIADLIENL